MYNSKLNKDQSIHSLFSSNKKKLENYERKPPDAFAVCYKGHSLQRKAVLHSRPSAKCYSA